MEKLIRLLRNDFVKTDALKNLYNSFYDLFLMTFVSPPTPPYNNQEKAKDILNLLMILFGN